MATILISILAFIGIIMLLALPHELGHFLAARRAGIRVHELGVGFPPRLLAIRRGETVYSLNAIPAGGFTKMAGELDPAEPGGFAGKGVGPRLAVLGAGSICNALLPIVLLSIPLMIPHEVTIEKVMVREVLPDSPAERAGIREGDQILTFDWAAVPNVGELRRQIYINLGREVNVLVMHPGQVPENLKLTPRWIPRGEQNATGLVVGGARVQKVAHRYPLWQAVPLAITETMDLFVTFKNVVVSMALGITPVVLTGPVGIVEILNGLMGSGAFSLGFMLQLTSFMSANLAVINLFPLPALDGGRMALILVEWIRRGKRLSPKVEGLIHGLGFALLLIFILFIAYEDVLNIIHPENRLP